MSFEHIVGHEKIIENLKNAIKNDKVAHSYLFEGPKSIGKETTGRAFAKALLSLSEDMDLSNNPDFKIIDDMEKTIKKQDIEALQKDIKVRPYAGSKKVYIICDGDRMTPEAQNSFLKTLEEPPSYASIIITTTNRDKLLSTIVSRCQPILFNYVNTGKIEEMLTDKFEKSQEQAKFIANFSNGIVGRAVQLCKNDFETLREATMDAIDITITSGREKIFTTSDFFEKNKANIDEILDMMILYFRDVLIYGETGSEANIINSDKIDTIKNHYNHLYKYSLHDIINSVLSTKENIDLKVNFSLCIEMMLLEIQEGCAR